MHACRKDTIQLESLADHGGGKTLSGNLSIEYIDKLQRYFVNHGSDQLLFAR